MLRVPLYRLLFAEMGESKEKDLPGEIESIRLRHCTLSETKKLCMAFQKGSLKPVRTQFVRKLGIK